MKDRLRKNVLSSVNILHNGSQYLSELYVTELAMVQLQDRCLEAGMIMR